MALTDAQRTAVQRIVARLRSDDPTAYRAGGRSVAHQCVEQRGEMVRALRGELSELGEHAVDERRRGYQEALEDVLLAAEAAIEPREQEQRARHELAAAPALQVVLDHVAAAPLTPSEAAKRIAKSAATGTRIFERLRTLDLVAEMPSVDGRERPHRVTVLGARLARAPKPTPVRTPVPHETRPWRASSSGGAGGGDEHDPLTGTLRGDAFVRVLTSTMALHSKAREPMCVMRVDIAGYADLIASMDFAAADACVSHVASTLKDEFGAAAQIGRYEPDKFFVLLPQAAPAEANDRASELMSKLAPCPVNIGIAGADAAGKVDDILERSLASLKVAKERGPGQIKTWVAGLIGGKTDKPR